MSPYWYPTTSVLDGLRRQKEAADDSIVNMEREAEIYLRDYSEIQANINKAKLHLIDLDRAIKLLEETDVRVGQEEDSSAISAAPLTYLSNHRPPDR